MGRGAHSFAASSEIMEAVLINNNQWAIFTHDKEKAEATLNKIISSRDVQVVRRTNSALEMSVLFEDGIYVKWIRPNKNERGNKPAKAWIDLSIDSDTLNWIIKPMLIFTKQVLYI